MTNFKVGNLVRFAHEQNGGPVHRVVSVMHDGMIEIHDMGGYFSADLFTIADDIGDIPPSPKEAVTVDALASIEREMREATNFADFIDIHHAATIALRRATTSAEAMRERAAELAEKTWPEAVDLIDAIRALKVEG